MPNQITGKILVIGPKETITGGNGSITKREVVLNCSRRVDQWSDEWYENYPRFEFMSKHVDDPDAFNVGDVVTISFDLQGRKTTSNGQERYFTNIIGYKIEPYRRQQNAPAATSASDQTAAPLPPQGDENGSQADANKDDLPF